MILYNTCHVKKKNIHNQIKKRKVENMAYSAKSQKKYNEKCYRFSVKFTPSEARDVERFKKYLSENNLSAAGYIKTLIRKDLDEKGF